MTKNFLPALSASLLTSLLLVGCSTAEPNPAANPSPSPSVEDITVTPEENLSNDSEDLATEENVAFDLDFAINAADASCNKAMEEGVRETFADIGYIGVMVPESEAIESYSAAYFVDEEYSLIFSADYFLACFLAIEYSMLEESDADLAEVFTVLDASENGFTILVNHTDDYMYQYQAELDSEGFISSANVLNSDGIASGDAAVITYGFDASDKEILQTAYDLFFTE